MKIWVVTEVLGLKSDDQAKYETGNLRVIYSSLEAAKAFVDESEDDDWEFATDAIGEWQSQGLVHWRIFPHSDPNDI